jgi:hypothetical protein
MACVIIKLIPVPRPCSCACAQPPAAEQAAPVAEQADASNDGAAVVPFASMAAGAAPATTDPGTNNVPETTEEKSGSSWWWALGAALGLGILVKFSGNDKKNKSKKKRK